MFEKYERFFIEVYSLFPTFYFPAISIILTTQCHILLNMKLSRADTGNSNDGVTELRWRHALKTVES